MASFRGLTLGVVAAFVIFLFYVLPQGTPYHHGALFLCLALACVFPAILAAHFLNRHAFVV